MSVLNTPSGQDPWAGMSPSNPLWPPRRAVAIQHAGQFPISNTEDLPNYVRGLYVGQIGDVQLLLAGDDEGREVTLKQVPAGTYLNLQIRRVMDGTTAGDLVGFYG